MLRLAAAREGLDDDHAAAAAGTWVSQRARPVVGRCGIAGLRRFRVGRYGEQLAGAGNVGGTVAVGEQSVVADAVKAPGQHVQEEAPDELVGGERHRLVSSGPLD